jgi:S1-C subfamily serine protease
MLRDRDEWRRPWREGEAALPPRLRGSRTSARPWQDAPAGASGLGDSALDAAERERRGDGGLAAAFDGAFDVVEDVTGPRSGTYGRSAAPDVAPPGSGPHANVAAASTAPYATSSASLPASVPGGVASAGRAAASDARAPRRSGGSTLVVALAAGAAGALLTVVALLGLGVLPAVDVAATNGAAPAPSDPALPSTQPPLSSGATAGQLIPDVADLVLPSVVRINVRGANVDVAQQGALGSGVIYRSDGYIITNHHVIQGAAGVEVRLANGDRLNAEIVGSDVLNDLAVLRIDRDGLPAINLRPDAEALRVGETVIAVGSPFGLDATVTSGIVSALNRDLRVPGTADTIPAVIQTDAAINPGNSGGALVDLQGRLIGINTAIVSRTGTNEGVGFAVSVQQAVASSDQLIDQGFVRHPLLGITGADVTQELATAFRLESRRGAVVDTVQPGSGAEAGGMRPGDVIVAVDGTPLGTMSELVAEVRRRTPGSTVVFDVVRNDAGARVRLAIEVVLGERPRS